MAPASAYPMGFLPEPNPDEVPAADLTQSGNDEKTDRERK